MAWHANISFQKDSSSHMFSIHSFFNLFVFIQSNFELNCIFEQFNNVLHSKRDDDDVYLSLLAHNLLYGWKFHFITIFRKFSDIVRTIAQYKTLWFVILFVYVFLVVPGVEFMTSKATITTDVLYRRPYKFLFDIQTYFNFYCIFNRKSSAIAFIRTKNSSWSLQVNDKTEKSRDFVIIPRRHLTLNVF